MPIKLKSVNWRNIKLPKGTASNWYIVSEAVLKSEWVIVQYEESTYKLIIKRRDIQMAIYLSTMTVQTAMNHPTKGKTQLTRKKITAKEFEKLLINPRLHTGKGKY